jgi:hydroxyacylglutathione hydrolase
MLFRQIFDPKLAQYAYLIGCQQTKEAIVVDPERDVDQYLRLAEEEGLRIVAVAETHIHADFLSGAREMAERVGAKLYLSAEGEKEGWPSRWAQNGRYNVTFLRDGDTFTIGNIEFKAFHTPGHTPEHLCYLVTDRGGGATDPMGLITGDFVFVGDLGRPDLLESAAKISGMKDPSARRLYQSVLRFLDLPDYLQLWPGHGAGSACGKALGAVPTSTVGYEKRFNASLAPAHEGEEAFVQTILSGQPEPPLYYARMKAYNRDGVPLLGFLPMPRRLSVAELDRLVRQGEVTFIDTRLDRIAFMHAHLPGALYAPFNRSFNTVVGSLVADDQKPLALIIDEEDVEQAVRDLVRIGYDRIEAYVTPETLVRYFNEGGARTSIPMISFAEVARLRTQPDVAVLDVRYAAEFDAGHIPGAFNASYTRLPEYLDRIPKDRTLLVHCATGGRSAAAASFLAAQGYSVRYVADDFAVYQQMGPIESSVPVTA